MVKPVSETADTDKNYLYDIILFFCLLEKFLNNGFVGGGGVHHDVFD